MDNSFAARSQIITANRIQRKKRIQAGVPAREIALLFFHILIANFGVLRFCFRRMFTN